LVILKGNIMTLSQKERVLTALRKGQTLTAKQMTARFGIASPTKVVSRLREDGYRIDTKYQTNSKGVTHSKYMMSTL
jgi:DNA-directed RNA polymerase specialized sigma subunit